MTSSSWLWLAAGLYLVFEIWRGWRRGIVRHGVSVMALLTAGGIGWIFAWMTGFIADRIIPLPVPAGRMIFGVAAAIAFYVAAVVLSSLLFKKTSQQSAGVVRLIYGFGGAFFGLVFGLLILWGGISMVRALGAMAEGQQAAAAGSRMTTPVVDGPLASLKQSMDEGVTGGVVDAVDIVPGNVYDIISKLMQVTRSPEATARFFSCSETQKLLAQPAMARFFNDPAVSKAASEGNVLAVLTSPKLAALASDPAVQQAFGNFELEKALDYALQTPPTSPGP